MATQDGYELYYTEKLWNWIPGFYREEDAYTDTPGTLREIVEALGEQSAELRRSIDRLWENSFVELADDDALVKLGELVATRMVHALNRRARRVDVARTIYYRRRKGTPWVLERLINDIAGWTGSHLDTRRRLARTYHLLEPHPQVSPVTLTPRGGWAKLHSPRIPELAWTAFEELNHTPDFRRYSGHEGRYGIAKIGVHIHRMRALKVTYPSVAVLDVVEGKFALDPSGRAAPLFQPADRLGGEGWTRPREWQMPRAIERRLLANTEYEWSEAMLAALESEIGVDEVGLLEPYSGWRVRSTAELERLIESLPDGVAKTSLIGSLATFMDVSRVPECGSAQLYGKALALAIGENNGAADLPWQQVLVANLGEWGANLEPSLLNDYDAIIDPTTGAVLCSNLVGTDTLIAPLLHHGSASELGAGSYDRRASVATVGVNKLSGGADGVGPIGLTPNLPTAIDEIVNSKTYAPPAEVDNVEDYRLQAANLERPYLLISNNAATWTITAKAKADPSEVRKLVLDGLWIGVEDADGVYPIVLLNPDDPWAPVAGKLVLAGTWDRVEIRHCTLDPGGEKIRVAADKVVPIPYVSLEIQGFIEELIVDSSVLGPVVENVSGAEPCSVGKFTIRDSVVISPDQAETPAISTQFAELHVERSSIVGDLIVNRLYASDSLIVGAGTIADLQHGCFRFSAGVEGTWPRPFESHFYPSFPAAWIETLTFGQPGFLRLSELAPIELREGAENHCEMGVYNKLIEPIKRADLRNKLEEFMPFDLIEQIDLEN
ncbi:MAG: hypothetical protein R6X02_25270 [Enhygromyxa sp.]